MLTLPPFSVNLIPLAIMFERALCKRSLSACIEIWASGISLFIKTPFWAELSLKVAITSFNRSMKLKSDELRI